MDYETGGGKLRGFLGCTNPSGKHVSQPGRMRMHRAFFEPIARLDGVELPKPPLGGPPMQFFERDEYYWAPANLWIGAE
jgi:hypothetical protein